MFWSQNLDVNKVSDLTEKRKSRDRKAHGEIIWNTQRMNLKYLLNTKPFFRLDPYRYKKISLRIDTIGIYTSGTRRQLREIRVLTAPLYDFSWSVNSQKCREYLTKVRVSQAFQKRTEIEIVGYSRPYLTFFRVGLLSVVASEHREKLAKFSFEFALHSLFVKSF